MAVSIVIIPVIRGETVAIGIGSIIGANRLVDELFPAKIAEARQSAGKRRQVIFIMKLQPQSPESLTREHWDVPIRVGLASYVDFSRSIDQQLEGLVLHWQHKAAPAAIASGRMLKP